MTSPVQAAGEVYGVLKFDDKIYATNTDNSIPTNTIITDETTVTHLFAANDVTTITADRFYQFPNLIAVNMPQVTAIDDRAFYECDAITSLEFPVATTIGEATFKDCDDLTSVKFEAVLTLDEQVFSACTQLTSVEFPAVTTISDQAFYNCSALKTAQFPVATTIGDEVFYFCSMLETVEMPAVTTIGDYAFYGCDAFSKLTLGAEPPNVGGDMFHNIATTSTLALAGGNTTATVAAYKAVNDGDTTDDTWYGWPLVAIHYPVTVTGGIGSAISRVGDEVTITADAPAAGKYFAGWTIQTGGMTLADPAKPSTTFTMPAAEVGVTANFEDILTTNISFDANGGTGSMLSQQIDTGSPQALTANAFTRTDVPFVGWNTKPDGSGTAYADGAEFTATKNESITLYAQWKQNVYGILKSDDKIYQTNADNSIPTNTIMADETTVTHLFTAEDVTTIEGYRFSWHPNLMAVSMPKVITIGEYAFSDCDALTHVEMPAATTIDKEAFSQNEILTKVVGLKVETIGKMAFGYCPALETVEFPAATTIGDEVFYFCGVLETAQFPMATTIGSYAFYHCEILPAAYFPSVIEIAYDAFDSCFALSNLTLGAVPPTVGLDVFYGIPISASWTLALAGGNTTATVAAYKAVNDGDTTDDTWYGWPLVVTHYPVTVTGGTQSANYRVGEQVTITAAAPAAGQRFKTWSVETGDMTLAEPTNPSTTFIMPEKAVKVTANYEAAPGPGPGPSQTYTLTYNANGGTGIMKEQVFVAATKQALVKNTFERIGYGFSGWNTKPDGMGTTYPDGADFTAIANTTLYAQWTEGRFKVSGTVVDSSNNPVSGVSMELKQGNRQIGQTVNTDAAGNFTINQVPNGNYDLVVSKNGVVVTVIVRVDNTDSVFSGTITLPAGKLNSVVEVKANTPEIVVGNLDKQFDKTDEEIAANGGLVEIKFVAEKQDETVPGAAEIMMTAASTPQTVGLFMDLSILKTIGLSTQSIDALPSLIDVLIPLDDSLQGKKDYFIYRYHGAVVDVITTTANEQGEKIELIDDGATLKMSVKQFSTYAIAYNEAIVDGISYRTHVQNNGWESSWATDGNPAGTEGQSLRLEGIQMKIIGDNLPAGAKIEYRTHVQNKGWESS